MNHSKPQRRKTASVPEERRANEYLANERTFLAWIRTSISVIGFGFLINRFSIWMRTLGLAENKRIAQSSVSLVVATTMMAVGAILAVLAVWRYHIVNRAIDEGQVTADSGLVILSTVLVVLLACGSIVFVVLTN